jgi:hypothetical protein
MDSNARLALPVGSVTLGGLVSRVDVTLGGYRGVLLGQAGPGWRTELRMPLIQAGLAMRYDRPIDQFNVGVQRLDGTMLEETHFVDREVTTARTRLEQLLNDADVS